jgi:hypothetical protein
LPAYRNLGDRMSSSLRGLSVLKDAALMAAVTVARGMAGSTSSWPSTMCMAADRECRPNSRVVRMSDERTGSKVYRPAVGMSIRRVTAWVSVMATSCS